MEENLANAELIFNFLQNLVKDPLTEFFTKPLEILDVCCGAYTEIGTSYDPNGNIYEPIVAEFLGKHGYLVMGVDQRENSQKREINYSHKSQFNVFNTWETQDLINKDVVIFLRSWDTPELILEVQKSMQISDINQLCLYLAKLLIPKFVQVLNSGGILIFSEILRIDHFRNLSEYTETKSELKQLLERHKLSLIKSENGIYFYKLL